jgi:flagellar protein FliO/FliZ
MILRINHRNGPERRVETGMEWADLIRAIAALALTLGLVGAAAVIGRRFGPGALGRLPSRAPRRLAVVESLVLDPSRRLVVIRVDDRETPAAPRRRAHPLRDGRGEARVKLAPADLRRAGLLSLLAGLAVPGIAIAQAVNIDLGPAAA